MLNTQSIFLSDRAYLQLCEKAHLMGFIRQKTNRGIGLYLIGLLKVNKECKDWKDTRPEKILEGSTYDLLEGNLPTWDDGTYRWPRRMVKPSTELLEVLLKVALSRGIMPQEKVAHIARRPLQIQSQFWEAVGLGWLTPEFEPEPYPYRQ